MKLVSRESSCSWVFDIEGTEEVHSISLSPVHNLLQLPQISTYFKAHLVEPVLSIETATSLDPGP